MEIQNVDERSGWSNTTALMTAAEEGDDSAVVTLLHLGADIEMVNRFGRTALYHASMSGHASVVCLLLAARAVMSANNDGWTPLMVAANRGHGDVVSVLLGAGADTEMVDRFGQTALNLASSRNRLGVVRLLLSAGATMRANNGGWTPLMVACNWEHLECAAILHEEGGADLDAVNSNGWTAILTVAQHGSTGAAEYLIATGADLDRPDNNGGTALMWAAHWGKLGMVLALARAGADMNVRGRVNGTEGTAAEIAEQHGYIDVAVALRKFQLDRMVRRRSVESFLMAWSPYVPKEIAQLCGDFITKTADN